MSKEEWAFKNIVRYNLCVDFYANKITTTDDTEWFWQGTDIKDFYSLLVNVIDEEKIRESEE